MHAIGAEKLNREIGAKPMRSRHCNEERSQTMPLEYSGKAWWSNDSESGELPSC